MRNTRLPSVAGFQPDTPRGLPWVRESVPRRPATTKRPHAELSHKDGLSRLSESLMCLTTLSAASLVVLVMSSERMSHHDQWGFLIGCAVLGFAVSLIGSVVAETAPMLAHRSASPAGVNRSGDARIYVFLGGAVAALAGLSVGVVSLATLALKNII